jgi:hypothetical protein
MERSIGRSISIYLPLSSGRSLYLPPSRQIPSADSRCVEIIGEMEGSIGRMVSGRPEKSFGAALNSYRKPRRLEP